MPFTESTKRTYLLIKTVSTMGQSTFKVCDGFSCHPADGYTIPPEATQVLKQSSQFKAGECMIIEKKTYANIIGGIFNQWRVE